MTIVFDMDGTLVDTMKMTGRAFRDLAEAHGFTPLSDERIRGAIGLSDKHFYRALYPDADWETLSAFGRAVEARENEWAKALGPAILFPGVREMLIELKASGAALYIASCGSRSHVTTSLSEGGVLGLFDRVSCGQSDKAGMTAGLIAGLDPARCAIVGDTKMDAAAGRQSGIAAFGAGFGYLKPEEYPLFDRVFSTPFALTARLTGEGEAQAYGKEG